MKHFFLSLFLLIGVALSGQVDLKCYTYDSFQSSDCYGCGIRTGHFSGIIVTTNGIKIALHKPVKISYRASNIFFEDPFGNKYNCSISSIKQEVINFVSECLAKSKTYELGLYISDIHKVSNETSDINTTTILNTEQLDLTFTEQGQYINVSCDNPFLLSNILSVSFIRTDGVPTTARVYIDGINGLLKLPVYNGESFYKLSIQFYKI